MSDQDIFSRICDPRFGPLCARVVQGMGRWGVPGAVVGVLHGDREQIAAFGVTSVEHPLPVTEDTLFQIGSITKTLTTTAIMRLVEMGVLDLDLPIRTYLPGLCLADESVAARITLRHLLTHTGGFVGDYYDDFGSDDDALARMVAAMAGLPQLTPLGEVWSYNTSGFCLAGRVVEALTGRSFEVALKELLLDPLGLTTSTFFAREAITRRFAVGHNLVDGQPAVARPWEVPRFCSPSGGILCALKDLLRFARFHMGDGAAPDGMRLLTPRSIALMQTPFLPASGVRMMGLGWFITPVGGHKIIGHNGGTNGQASDLKIVPEERFAIAVFTNSEAGGTLCNEIGEAALASYLGITISQPVPLHLPEGALLPYAGRYESAMVVREIMVRDGGLVLQTIYKGGFPTPDTPPPPPPPAAPAALYGEDRVVVLEGPMAGALGEFLRDAGGRIVWLRLSSRIHARQPSR